MAKIVQNFVRGVMNKSVDERLIRPGEYIDALNVRLGSTEGTEIGAVENSKGNTKLTSLLMEAPYLIHYVLVRMEIHKTILYIGL